MVAIDRDAVDCSFCRKLLKDVAAMVTPATGGPTICDECVAVSIDILSAQGFGFRFVGRSVHRQADMVKGATDRLSIMMQKIKKEVAGG